MRKVVLAFTMALGGGAFIGGLMNYSGDSMRYSLFSLVFLALLVSGLRKESGYGYLFLTIFLWLGFWFKLTSHLIFPHEYVEPTGQFDASPKAWDDVLLVSTVSALGVLMGRLVYQILQLNKQTKTTKLNLSVPIWYPLLRKHLWIVAFILVNVIPVVNIAYGIHQIGLTPRHILIWPLNATIAWMVNFGSAMMIVTLVWWELIFNKNTYWAVFSILLEAMLSGVSALSRSAYLFHTIPLLFTLYQNRALFLQLSMKRLIFIGVIAVGLFSLSMAGVMTARAYLYPHKGGFTTESGKRLVRIEVLEGGIAHIKKLISQGELREAELQALLDEKSNLERLESVHINEGNIVSTLLASNPELQRKQMDGVYTTGANAQSGQSMQKNLPFSLLAGEFITQLKGAQLATIVGLGADRWVGLEGVMAVSAFREKGWNSFVNGLLEKRVNGGKATLYQFISHSSYRYTDSTTWQFATLPGITAFLYLSGTLWVVFLGMMVLTWLVLFWERFVYITTENPLMCSLLALAMANSIAQFGVGPREAIPQYSMMLCGILAIWLLRSPWLTVWLKSHCFPIKT